ncbi:MAG: PTS sugar transporter subunit IIB [Elusimicrobiota bacterium]|jgi:PTS system mannose-specific IIB component
MMRIALARIDDRLVHGQVVMGWIPHLDAKLVIVVSDTAVADATHTALMQMAMPDDVELQVLTAAGAVEKLRSETDKRRVLVLAPGPQEIRHLLELGLELRCVNVGGLHYTAGRVQLGKAIFLSPEDKAALRDISKKGVTLEGRALPGDAPINVVDMIGVEL